MTLRTRSLAVAGLVLAVSAAVAVAKVEHDLSVPGRTVETIPARPVHQGPLRAQCWQKGVKILDEEDLEGLSITAATRESTVTFKRGDQQASVFLLSLGESLCLLQPER